MIKQLWRKTCAFDVEWVPCVDTGRRLLGLGQDVSDQAVMEAIWREYAKEDGERPFLKLALCKVVSIAAIFREVYRDGTVQLSLYMERSPARLEGSMIQEFLEKVAGGGYQLWGYNSSSSDVPILVQRAIALGYPCPMFAKRPPKPWTGPDYFDVRNSTAHVDMLDAISGFSGSSKPKLHEWAAACSIPGKLGTTGNDVADLYLSGEYEKILEYNITDALTTHLAMLKLCRFCGYLDEHQYTAEVDAVRTMIQSAMGQQYAAIQAFDDVWSSYEHASDDVEINAQDIRLHWKELQLVAKQTLGIKCWAALNSVRDVGVADGRLFLAFGTNEFAYDLLNHQVGELKTVFESVYSTKFQELVLQLGDIADMKTYDGDMGNAPATEPERLPT